jgi:hypothetical protein
MMRSLFAILFVVVSFSCTRHVRLPKSAANPITSPVTRGVNAASKAFDYETSEVKVQLGVSKGIAIKGLPISMGRINLSQTRSFDIKRKGQDIASPSCTLTHQGDYASFGLDKTVHTMACNDVDFELAITQNKAKAYTGTFVRGGKTYTIMSTTEMADGPVANSLANGFHVYEDKQWLGTFEYYFGGNMYLAPNLSEEAREAAVLVSLSLAASNNYLVNDPKANESTTGYAAF